MPISDTFNLVFLNDIALPIYGKQWMDLVKDVGGRVLLQTKPHVTGVHARIL